MKIDPKRLRLYAVTDRAWTHDAEGLLRQVAAAVDGGAGIVQLREKHMGQADFLVTSKSGSVTTWKKLEPMKSAIK